MIGRNIEDKAALTHSEGHSSICNIVSETELSIRKKSFKAKLDHFYLPEEDILVENGHGASAG